MRETRQRRRTEHASAGSGPFLFSFWGSTATNATLAGAALPALECGLCGECMVEVAVSFPSLEIPNDVDPKLLKGGMKTVDQRTWLDIQDAFSTRNPAFDAFLPGMHVGPITLRTTGRLRDVLCVGIEVFFSVRVVQHVRSAGVAVHPSAVQVFKKGRRVEDYYALEPTVATVTHKDWMMKCYSRCRSCHKWKLKIPFKDYLVLDKARTFDASHWPGGEGVVYTPDRPFTLYSETFVAACEGTFTDLVFERAGIWA